MRSCTHDARHPIPAAADPRQVYCSDACRVAAHRERSAQLRARTLDLLRRQSLALTEGADAATLAALAKESSRLLRNAVATQ